MSRINKAISAARSFVDGILGGGGARSAQERRDTDTVMPSLWQNIWNGLGGSGDRLSAHVPTAFSVLSVQSLEALGYGDAIARRIVWAPVLEAFRQGYQIRYRGGSDRDQDMLSDIAMACDEIDLENKAKMAAGLARQFGGAGLLLGVNAGGGIAAQPLADGAVRTVDYLSVLDRRDLSVLSYQPAIERGHFPEHEIYIPTIDEYARQITAAQLHASYLSHFGAAETATRDRQRFFGGWDAPVLQPVWEVLRRFHSDHQSVGAMIQDGSQGILKIQDLWKVVAESGLSVLEDRLQLLRTYRSSARLMPLSTGEDHEEKFEWVERSFAGIPDLLREDQALIAAAANMPITVLFGRSPAGENATGEHDAKNWHATVESLQRTSFGPPIDRVVRLVAQTLGASEPDAFGVSWPSLEILSAKERADLEKTIAEGDDIRIDQGVPAETILLHRYAGDEYQIDPPQLTEEDVQAIEGNLEMERLKPEPSTPQLPESPDVPE